jgi:L,D-peptidoglycan transpeptidase YkuD (ErfK/YbiS/YcfS/YnhG family)
MMRITRRKVLLVGGVAAANVVSSRLLYSEPQEPKLDREFANVISVTAKPGAFRGTLSFQDRTYPCMLGRSGVVQRKFEGDGGTPAGIFPLREVRYRPDRIDVPKTGLPVFKSMPTDGWCDDPADSAYNRIVSLPHQTDAEMMWRDDHLYDLLAIVGYNDSPPIPGAGSAIFLHVMRPPVDAHQYTAGCVSLVIQDLLRVLASCTPSTVIDIHTG